MGFIEETKKPEPQGQQPFSFDFSEEKDEGKETYVIFGLKGSTKTSTALSFPGKILALSFDNKTTIVKNNFFQGNERIKVFNATKYLIESAEDYLDSSVKTYDYIIAILEKVGKEFKPDFILFDCAEIMTTVCEMVMRKNNNVSAYGGIVNRNIWKQRKALLTNIHRKALDICNKGLIYTLYINKDEIVEEGEIKTKADVPAWTGIIMYETDFVIKTELKYSKEKGKQCLAHIVSSKNDNKLKTGTTIDITDFKNKLLK